MSKNVKEGVKIGKFGRRTWDKEVYEKIAENVANDEIQNKVNVDRSREKKHLEARKDSLNLERFSGKRQTVEGSNSATGSLYHVGSFKCKHCNLIFKDSISYIDHLNSRIHLYNIGMTNRAVRATVEDVRRKLSIPPPKKKKRGSEKKSGLEDSMQAHASGVQQEQEKKQNRIKELRERKEKMERELFREG